MSLDLIILGSDGAPKHAVSIDVDKHQRLVKAIERTGGGLLARLHDYYADAEFSDEELEELIKAVIQLREQNQDADLVSLLNSLVQLAELAKIDKSCILAIAD